MTSKGHHWTKTPEQAANSARAKLGHPVSPETRRRLSEAAKLRQAQMTPEQKAAHAAKVSAATKGRPKSKQTRARMVTYSRNRPQSHNQRISTALKGRPLTAEHIAAERASKLATGSWKPIGHTYIRRGYRWIKVSHGKGRANYRAEHRYVLEQTLGRELTPDEHVHHIDGNSLNNTPSNLALVSRRAHTLITGLLAVIDQDLARVVIATLTQRLQYLDSESQTQSVGERRTLSRDPTKT